MKFSEKFKKNKGEAAVPETAQDSGKKKHKPDPKKLVGTISKKHIKNGSYSMAMAAVFIVIVVVINIRYIPDVFATIFREAFDFQAIFGAFAGFIAARVLLSKPRSRFNAA